MLNELNEQQIRKTAVQIGIPSDFVRKDYFVTKAIQTLICVENEYFYLVFQGGTSLSKGYQLIRRLSEDIDFRVVQKPMTVKFGKEARRKYLREFRYTLIQALRDAGFNIPNDAIKVFYEGRFMSITAEFDDSRKISYLKPHIAIDCFLGELALEPSQKEITSLIKLTLGEECEHPFFSATCIALDETAAEKWVALTRRVAGTQDRSRQSDKHLVRHLYDLYHLKMSGLLKDDFCKIIYDIMQKDRAQFKKHNSTYADDPISASEKAIDLLYKDQQWVGHWDLFLEQMVYEENKPSFDEAYSQLQELSLDVFEALKQQ